MYGYQWIVILPLLLLDLTYIFSVCVRPVFPWCLRIFVRCCMSTVPSVAGVGAPCAGPHLRCCHDWLRHHATHAKAYCVTGTFNYRSVSILLLSGSQWIVILPLLLLDLTYIFAVCVRPVFPWYLRIFVRCCMSTVPSVAGVGSPCAGPHLRCCHDWLRHHATHAKAYCVTGIVRLAFYG
jgi:hypothetical protein